MQKCFWFINRLGSCALPLRSCYFPLQKNFSTHEFWTQHLSLQATKSNRVLDLTVWIFSNQGTAFFVGSRHLRNSLALQWTQSSNGHITVFLKTCFEIYWKTSMHQTTGVPLATCGGPPASNDNRIFLEAGYLCMNAKGAYVPSRIAHRVRRCQSDLLPSRQSLALISFCGCLQKSSQPRLPRISRHQYRTNIKHVMRL